MIFKEEHVKWILDKSPFTGKPKTQTRRIAYGTDIWENDEIVHGRNTHVLRLNKSGLLRRLYCNGRTYSVQPGRGKSGVARIEITNIKFCNNVCDIDLQDVIKEGFSTKEQFLTLLQSLYKGKGDICNKPFWALDFKVVNY